MLKKKEMYPNIILDIKRYFEISVFEIISIFHGCMVWIEKSVTRVTDRHH